MSFSTSARLRYGDEKEASIIVKDDFVHISFRMPGESTLSITFKDLEQLNNFVERIEQEIFNYELENNPDIKQKVEESEFVQESEDYTHFLK